MYVFLDIFFVVFHSLLILFILSGWVWIKTRPLHLTVMIVTMISWFGLGVIYGPGYCFATDWHWQVKVELGETDLPVSYVKYYVDRLTGFDWDAVLVNTAVLIIGLAAFVGSAWLNWRDWKSCYRMDTRQARRNH